jgi:hypothetical protein
MKNTRPLMLSIALLLVACGGPLKYSVASSAKAPGADAKIVADVKKDQNETALEINVENLAPPSRVLEGSSVYVVWQRKDDKAKWSRIGSLKFDEGARKGNFTGSVPETAFDLEISAEKDASAESPSGDAIFAQHVN